MPTLILASFIGGWGAGILNPSLNTIAAEDERPKLMHWLHAAFGIGASTGPLVITWLISMGFSWRTGYWFIGGIFAFTAVFFLATISHGEAFTPHTIGLQVAMASIGASIVPGLAGLAAGKWGLEIIGLFVMGTAVLLLLVHQWTKHTETVTAPKKITHTAKQAKKHAI